MCDRKINKYHRPLSSTEHRNYDSVGNGKMQINSAQCNYLKERPL